MIPTPSVLLGLLKGWQTPANKLLANCYHITACDCETTCISYVTFEAWQLFPCISERCTCGVRAWFFNHGVCYATGVTDTMVCGQGTLRKGGTSRYLSYLHRNLYYIFRAPPLFLIPPHPPLLPGNIITILLLSSSCCLRPPPLTKVYLSLSLAFTILVAAFHPGSASSPLLPPYSHHPTWLHCPSLSLIEVAFLLLLPSVNPWCCSCCRHHHH